MGGTRKFAQLQTRAAGVLRVPAGSNRLGAKASASQGPWAHAGYACSGQQELG